MVLIGQTGANLGHGWLHASGNPSHEPTSSPASIAATVFAADSKAARRHSPRPDKRATIQRDVACPPTGRRSIGTVAAAAAAAAAITTARRQHETEKRGREGERARETRVKTTSSPRPLVATAPLPPRDPPYSIVFEIGRERGQERFVEPLLERKSRRLRTCEGTGVERGDEGRIGVQDKAHDMEDA